MKFLPSLKSMNDDQLSTGNLFATNELCNLVTLTFDLST